MKKIIYITCIFIVLSCSKEENNTDNKMAKELILTDSKVENINNDIERLIFQNNFRGIIPYSKIKELNGLNYLESKNGGVREFISEGLFKLDTLILSENRIDILVGLDDLSNLKYIDVSKNRIKTIKDTGIEKVISIVYLDASYNLLKSVKSVGSLKNLESLNLSSNRLIELDIDLKDYPNLEYLDISDNLLQELPEGIIKLKKLKQLNVFNNFIMEQEIDELKKIRPEIVIR